MPPRTILYTGKGGVGKTSVAAAVARRSAALGRRTVIVSTDPAHSLSDAIETRLGPDPVRVAPRLWGQEVIAETEMHRHWDRVGTWMSGLLLDRGVDRIRAEELTVPPGLGELFSLLQIKRHWEGGEFDVVIVDCAPSGETLRLLGYPEIAGWWMRKIFPGNRALLGVAAPLARALEVPLPEPELVDEVELLLENLLAMDEILRDRRHSSVRLVMNPDRMVIDEARRTFAHLGLFGYQTDAVIVNRLFPPEVEGGYFGGWRRRQGEHLKAVEEGFAPVPVLTAPFFEREVIGREMHDLLADELHGQADPTAILHPGLAREIVTGPDGTVVRIRVPFAGKDQVRVQRAGDELIVTAGDLRRTIILPGGLMRQNPDRASLRDGILEISFKKERDAEPQTAPN